MPASGDPAVDGIMEATKAGVGMGVAALRTTLGLINAGKAKREADLLKRTRPVRQTSQDAIDQKALAESELANGMSAEARAAYESGIDRDLSSSIDAILKGGGTVNNIGDLFDSSNEARQKLSIMKDNLRLNQINNLVRAQTNMQNETDQNFFYNKVAPWTDAAQANAQARQNASSMIWQGINSGAATAMSGINDMQQKRQLDGYFNVPQTTVPQQMQTTPINQPFSPYNTGSTIDVPLNRTPSLDILGSGGGNRSFIGAMPYTP